jgi:hypothetical protein
MQERLGFLLRRGIVRAVDHFDRFDVIVRTEEIEAIGLHCHGRSMSLLPSTRESDPRPTGARSDVRRNGREPDGVKAACYAASVPARMTEVIVAGAQWCR